MKELYILFTWCKTPYVRLKVALAKPITRRGVEVSTVCQLGIEHSET